MKTDVVVIGELLVDLISEELAENISEVRSFRVFPGGSPANLCANLNWLGVKSTLISSVGDDGAGKYLIDSLNKAGVSTDHVIVHADLPTSMILVARSEQTPDFIPYRFADPEIKEINVGIFRQAKLLHSSAFALSREPARSSILKAMERAVDNGSNISVDWNFSPKVWASSDQDEVFQRLSELNPILKMSLDDIRRFRGIELSIEEAKKFLEELPLTITCLTCGREGVWYRSFEEPEWQHHPALKVKKITDVTGAGDAFWAGFISAWCKKDCLKDCVLEGLKIAAMKIEKQGPLYLGT